MDMTSILWLRARSIVVSFCRKASVDAGPWSQVTCTLDWDLLKASASLLYVPVVSCSLCHTILVTLAPLDPPQASRSEPATVLVKPSATARSRKVRRFIRPARILTRASSKASRCSGFIASLPLDYMLPDFCRNTIDRTHYKNTFL